MDKPPLENLILTSPQRSIENSQKIQATPNFNQTESTLKKFIPPTQIIQSPPPQILLEEYRHKFTTQHATQNNSQPPRFKLDLDKVHNAAIKREKEEEVQKKKLEVVRLNRHIAVNGQSSSKFIKKQALKVKGAIECIQQIQAEATYGMAEMNVSIIDCVDKCRGQSMGVSRRGCLGRRMPLKYARYYMRTPIRRQGCEKTSGK